MIIEFGIKFLEKTPIKIISCACLQAESAIESSIMSAEKPAGFWGLYDCW